MNAEIFEALTQLEKERGIPRAYMEEKITQALLAAYKKDRDGYTDNVFVKIDEGEISMFVRKTVVDKPPMDPAQTVSRDPEEQEEEAPAERPFFPPAEIQLAEARLMDDKLNVGDVIDIPIKTDNFGRIAAQTAKQVIIQGIREAERGMVFENFSSKEHEILTGTVLRVEPFSGDVTVRIGSGADQTDALLAASEQIRGERYQEGSMVRVYVVEVRRSTRGPQVIVSRTHPGLVKRLFELQVPEIESGLVEVRSIAREAGSRTKIAVRATEENIDPVGACVGPRGARVGAVVNELHGEKMDIVVWSEAPEEFISSALSPAEVTSVTVLPGTAKACRVVVADDQLSLAIGKEGQNARLAARLTGYKIDIRPASRAEDPAPEQEEAPEA